MISLKKLKEGESGKIQANYCNHKYKKGNLLGRAGKESFQVKQGVTPQKELHHLLYKSVH